MVATDILKHLQCKDIKLTGKGTVYPVKTGNQTIGLAFYYMVGDEKKRKVVTAQSEDELVEKAQSAINKIEANMKRKVGMIKLGLDGQSEAHVITFREVGDKWFEEYKQLRTQKQKLSYSSIESRGYSLQKIYKFIGDMDIASITDDVAEELLEKVSKKEDGTYFSKSSVDKTQQVFLLVMNKAHELGLCSSVPKKIKLSDRLTIPDKDKRFLDEDEIAEVMKAVRNNPRYNVLVTLLIATGLRQEEAFALNISDFKPRKDGNYDINIYKTDVETENHVYVIVEKTKTEGSKRVVTIPSEVYSLVMDYYNGCIRLETEYQRSMREKNGLNGYIFINKNGNVINKRTFEHNFKDFLKRNCGRNVDFETTLHMFRHSFVSFQAEEVGIEATAKMIGDSVSTTEKIYASITSSQKQQVCTTTSNVLARINSRM